MPSAKVSVIVAAYNVERYVKRCLDSVLGQTLTDFELIVVNDGSTDQTARIAWDVCQGDRRAFVIDQENKKLAETRKAGMAVAQGEFVQFVDGDDWLEPDSLEKLYEKGNASRCDIVLSNAYCAHDGGRVEWQMFNPDDHPEVDPLRKLLLGSISPPVWCKFMRRSFLATKGIEFPSNITLGEDLATVAGLFMHEPIIAWMTDHLYNYYRRPSSSVHASDLSILDVEQAVAFIELQLKKRGMYPRYVKEFEMLVFRHLFLNRIVKADKLTSAHEQLHRLYKNRKLNIRKNVYIMAELRRKPFRSRMRVKAFHASYALGLLYDKCRGLARQPVLQ